MIPGGHEFETRVIDLGNKQFVIVPAGLGAGTLAAPVEFCSNW